jgi:hypothetical protein
VSFHPDEWRVAMKKLGIIALVLSFFAFPYVAGAATFDGSKPLLCALTHALECTQSEGCKEVPIEDLNLPRFLVIDFNKKTIEGVEEGGRVSAIDSIKEIEGKLILQGAEGGPRGGAGWTLAVQEEDGEFVLTASGDLVAVVVFGACTPR